MKLVFLSIFSISPTNVLVNKVTVSQNDNSLLPNNRLCLLPNGLFFFCFVFYASSAVCSVSRLLIKNGNSIDSSTLYDSYEVEYLPNEGIVSSSRYLFIEFTTDGSGTNTGAAIRYEGMDMSSFLEYKCSSGLTSPLLPACSELTRQDCAQSGWAFFQNF